MSPHPTHAQRFTRRQRLTRPRDYSHVMAKARRSADKLFTVLARDNSLSWPRLGLAVSRKSARRAVDRNRIKRVSREVFRQCGHAGCVDVIVFSRHAAATASSANMRRSLEQHLRKLISEKTA